MKKRRWFLYFLVGAPLALAGALGGLYAFLTADEPPPDDSDLRLVRAVIPEEENGFALVDFPIGELELTRDVQHACEPASEEWDPDIAEATVKKHARALERFDESLERPSFQVPDFPTPSTRIPYLLSWRYLAALVNARVGLALDAGRDQEAFEEALKLVRFGLRIQGGKGVFVVFQVGTAIQAIGAGALSFLVARSKLGFDEIDERIAELENIMTEADPWDDVIRAEYVTLRYVFEACQRGDSKEVMETEPNWFMNWHPIRRFIFKHNKTKRVLAEGLRSLQGPWSRTSCENARDFPEEEATSFLSFENMLGRTWTALALRSCGKVAIKRPYRTAYPLVPRLVFALKQFKKERGDLPDTLDELVPRYLEKVPLDPFDGRPIRYSKKKRIIYSVATDGIDSGGEDTYGEGSPPTDDLSWKLNF